MTERRHLLDVPGGRPIEVEYRADAVCESCSPIVAESGDVVHGADCPAARALAARAARDITLDGAAELADEARAVFAEDYADVVLEDDERVTKMRAMGAGDSDEDLAPLRRELSLAYIAGFRRSEQALLSMGRAGARRIRDEVDQLISSLEAWAPGEPVSDGGRREPSTGNETKAT